MMTRERAEATYAILQLYAGAPEGGGVRDSFIHIHSTEDCPEFRFCGLLGHGGKYRAPRNKVDCYQEDETPERLAIIERTNKALAILDMSCNRRERLKQFAARFSLASEWEAVVLALEAGDVKPLLKLPSIERQFLEEEVPGVRELREKYAPTQ